jgi:hypothetical protein
MYFTGSYAAEVCARSFIEYTAQYVSELLRLAPELLGDERAAAECMWEM